MSDIMQGISLSDPNIREIDMSKLKRVHLSEMQDDEMFDHIMDMQERFLESQYTTMPDTTNSPRYAEYASVSVNGQIVAQIDNYGGASSSNKYGSKIQAAISEADREHRGKTSGPDIAQLRAEKIAKALGGKVNIADSALTQSEFNAAPEARASVDYEALRKDPAYETLQQTKRARTLYLAQEMGQNDNVSTNSSGSQAGAMAMAVAVTNTEGENAAHADTKTAEDEFKEYMDMTPEERYLAALLAKYDLTKEEFDALPLEEQEKIMAEVKQDVIESVEEKTGVEAGAMVSAMQA